MQQCVVPVVVTRKEACTNLTHFLQWDDETDMQEVERLVRTIQCDGLRWGASKFVKVIITFVIFILQLQGLIQAFLATV